MKKNNFIFINFVKKSWTDYNAIYCEGKRMSWKSKLQNKKPRVVHLIFPLIRQYHVLPPTQHRHELYFPMSPNLSKNIYFIEGMQKKSNQNNWQRRITLTPATLGCFTPTSAAATPSAPETIGSLPSNVEVLSATNFYNN